MATDLKSFATEYTRHLEQRATQGIPPLPLSPDQTRAVCDALKQPALDAALLKVHGQSDTIASLRHLLGERVPPGVYPASRVKAEFLSELVLGQATSPHLKPTEALQMLGAMGGGFNVAPLLAVLEAKGEMAATAARLLEDIILVTPDDVDRVKRMAPANAAAKTLLTGWAEASWFAHAPEVPLQQKRLVIRLPNPIPSATFETE